LQEENTHIAPNDQATVGTVKKERGIDWITIASIALVMFAVISLSLIQTYINKEIYFESRELSKIQKEYDILKEEQVSLQNSINRLRYENLVVDMISDIEAKKDKQ
jgi:nitrate reductase NapE component